MEATLDTVVRIDVRKVSGLGGIEKGNTQNLTLPHFAFSEA